jgi:hypothetical protein
LNLARFSRARRLGSGKSTRPINKSSVGESDFGFSKIVRSQDAMAHHALSFDA